VRYAGRLVYFLEEWKKITKDKEILDVIIGYKIPFVSQPQQFQVPKQVAMSEIETHAVQESILKLLSIGAIDKVNHTEGEFLSNIFVVPKPDKTFRLIINLKPLNKFIVNDHFKMEDYRTVCNLLQKNSYMATIDLKDAYYLISIQESDRKYLRFEWKNQLYQFNCLCFGLSTAPRVFTKLLKPLVSILRSEGYLSCVYLDDILLLGTSFQNCEQNIQRSMTFLETLGWIVNIKKSILQPCRSIRYLGFVFDSINLTISLPVDKREKVSHLCTSLLNGKPITIQKCSEVIGYLVSVSPAVAYSPLYIRQLELEKTKALHKSQQNFDCHMILSTIALEDLMWWKRSVQSGFQTIRHDAYDLVIYTDASLSGWGATSNGKSTRGFWTVEEKMIFSNHSGLILINELELLAIKHALLSLVNTQNISILIRSDNTTAISYINSFGGCRSPSCHAIAKDIWKWCESRNIWLHAYYISSTDNFLADALSRIEVDTSDFKLNVSIFNALTNKYGVPYIDLFASSNTNQLSTFYSWFPCPNSSGTDAFTYKWQRSFYAFPPFNLVARVLRKVIHDRTSGIVVAPFWESQPWFPLFKTLCNGRFTIIKPKKNNLVCPYDSRPHPLWKKLSLVAARVSYTAYKT